MITFIQYIRPNGRQRETTIERPAEIERKAQALIEAGHRFESEILTDDSTVSLTLHHVEEEVDVAVELAPNGPAIPEAVDRLVERAYQRLIPQVVS